MTRETHDLYSPNGLLQYILCDILCEEDLCGIYPARVLDHN